MLEWRFLYPWILALLPLPLIWLAWHYLRRARRHPSVLFSDTAPFAAGTKTLKIRVLQLMPVLRALVLILGIIALARPQFGQVERQRAALGVDIALAIDVSGSMQAADFTPNRLEAAKEVVHDFIDGRSSDRISLVVFASTAAVLCPPTFDRQAVKLFIDTIQDGILNNEKTAIGTGLALAVDKLRDSEAKSKIVILLTDGENNTGTIAPLQAAEAAKALGVRVYTIGVGSNSITEIPVQDPLFGQRMVRQQVTIDEETLQQIAKETGGRYFRATNEDALRQIYSEIDHLERTEIEVNEYDDFDERFMMFWTPALILLGLEFLLRGFWLVRLP
ncbi:VWA domain-containing protein [bacterium]|nr:VWA domain-containing protein [bacterium]